MMARDGRLESEWWQTAQILAQQANLNRGKGQPAIGAEKFNPFTQAKPPKPRRSTSLNSPNWPSLKPGRRAQATPTFASTAIGASLSSPASNRCRTFPARKISGSACAFW